MSELLNLCKEKMSKSTAALESEYAAIRAGRANPAVLNKLVVDYYGTPTPIAQMAAVSVPDPRVLAIQPWDTKLLKEIEHAINVSDIGLNPTNDGKIIRLNFPPLTEERRKDIVKDIKKMAEECKISIRNSRRDVLDKFKAMQKKSEISEDELKLNEKSVQDITDKFCKKADELAQAKEKEIMSI